MLISELAACVGLTIDTIRFYEKQGLMIDGLHYERTSNGYRHYSHAGVERLKLIRLAQAAGFTLSEMRDAIYEWETDQISDDEKVERLMQKMDEIEQKMEALAQVKAYLSSKIAQMHRQKSC